MRSFVDSRDADSLLFCRTPTPGLENFGLLTPTLGLKKLNSDSNSGPKKPRL